MVSDDCPDIEVVADPAPHVVYGCELYYIPVFRSHEPQGLPAGATGSAGIIVPHIDVRVDERSVVIKHGVFVNKRQGTFKLCYAGDLGSMVAISIVGDLSYRSIDGMN